ncbi:MAG: hypothetical protein GY757_26410 [bacterium]|nr:hypothetical protein [bacterium]
MFTQPFRIASIYGDNVHIKSNSDVFDIYGNYLVNSGNLRGEAASSLTLPLNVTLPSLPEALPGDMTIVVPEYESLTLEPRAQALRRCDFA